MKYLLSILLLVFIISACEKQSIPEPEPTPEPEPIEQNDPKKSVIKILQNNPVHVDMPPNVYLDFTVAYHVSTDVLSSQGFKVSGTISTDNDGTMVVFYGRDIYVRTDTLTIRYLYLQNNHRAKDSIRIKYSLLQRTSPNNYIVLATSDSLVYKLKK